MTNLTKLTFAGILAACMMNQAAAQTVDPTKLYLYSNNSIVFVTDTEQLDSIAWSNEGTQVTLFDTDHNVIFSSTTEKIDSMTQRIHTPKAALLDVVFNYDGSATDISPMKNMVEIGNSEKTSIYWNNDFGRYVAHFDNPWAGAAAGYYKVDYSSNNEFKAALAAGHSFECVVMADEVNNSEAKFFSSHQAGGTGLMICNKNDGRQYNSFTFLPNISDNGKSTWRWANSNVQPELKQFYHLVGVYDREGQKARIYVDGELRGEVDAPGDMIQAAADCQWFGIGCDPGVNKGEQAWHGDVVMARIYDIALTEYDVDALYAEAANSAAEEPERPAEPVALPPANILDIRFNEDGTATDLSAMANEVITVASDKLHTYYNESLGRYIAHFDNDYAGLAGGYYRVDYQDNQEIKSALEAGHSFECIVMTDISISDTEAKFFSTHGGGGTGLMICNTGGGRGVNSFTFLPNVSESGSSTWRWATSGVKPEPEQFYHVIGIYDKDNEKAEIYVNGELKCSVDAPGSYLHPNDVRLHWFGIGCDPGTRDGNAVGEQSWHGDVALARIYDKPLSADEVADLWGVASEELDILNAIPEIPEEPVELPVANLLDIRFNADGTATDISPMGNNVVTIASDKLYTYHNSAFDTYVAHFDNPWAGAASGYYKVDYSSNDEMKSALAAGHSIECIVMAEEVNNSEAKFFSSHQAGGTGFLICNKNDGRQYNSFTFLPNISETGNSTWRWANSNVQPEPKQFYHLVGVYDKDSKKARIYVNGRMRSEVDAPGEMVQAAAASQWFGIGCDPGGANGEQAWHGEVAAARIYDKPLTEEEITSLWSVASKGIDYEEPELITEARLYNLPVVAGKTYTIFGDGFEADDEIVMSGNGLEETAVTATPSERGVSVALPADFKLGQYQFVLQRGEQKQTLGNVNLTVVNQMPASSEIIAHRGHWNVNGSSQNSRASLQNAIDLNLWGSETDIWITKDDHLMINHDRSFGGVTLCESTYDQCKNLTLGNGEKMPELYELLDIVKASPETQTRIVLEIKDHGTIELDTRAANATLEAVEAAGLTGNEKIKYISFSRTACERIIELQPEADVQFLSSNANTALQPAQLKEKGYAGLDYEIGLLRNNLNWINLAHTYGLKVNVWTVDGPSDMIEMMNRGVDFITTNNPVAGLDIKWHYDHSAE
ncbi:MAG: hypothetical protein NC336_04135 [Clostridium sp.]|nr:hypothetical protein [Clostridium sp.]